MIRFFALLCRILPHQDFEVEGEVYLRRVYLTPRSWRLRVFLHFFFRGDEGLWLHDHPWDFWSFMLWRGYDELIKDGIQRHRWLTFAKYKAEHAHRVLITRPTATVCFVKPARRVWGFYEDDQWVEWREQLGLPPDFPTLPEDIIAKKQ